MATARIAVLCCILVAGCAGPVPRLAGPGIELHDTPFFPQTEYQCGPAATATVLGSAGFTATPDALAPEIYLPARRGSLQAEIIAAARRHGGVPFIISPALPALVAELRAGRPVLVLQNLGLPMLPVWHYAVVVGFDPVSDRLVLRSGKKRRQQVSTRRFLQTWEPAGYWALVVLRPGELPADPEPMRYLKAVAALESVGLHASARLAYAAALERWPSHPVAMLGLANSDQALGRYREAINGYRDLLVRVPDHAVGRNNLAEALAALGCYNAALDMIDEALASADQDNPLREALMATRRDIMARQRRGTGARCQLPY